MIKLIGAILVSAGIIAGTAVYPKFRSLILNSMVTQWVASHFKF